MTGDPWHYGRLRAAFEKAAARSGIQAEWKLQGKRLTLHTCRHTCASWLASSSRDIYLVSAQLGHANIATTQRYSHLAADRQAAEVEKMATEFLKVETGNTAQN